MAWDRAALARAQAGALLLVLAACASRPPVTDPSAFVGSGGLRSDSEKLSQLWEKRTEAQAADFPIGPGDLIELSVPGLVELEEFTARVGADGNVSLPLIGTLRAAGLLEDELREAIRARLEADVMYDPSVDLFVREYRSRLVGVIGAVRNPGFYPLASETDTLLDMIAAAGGMTTDANARIRLIPAATNGDGGAHLPLAQPPSFDGIERRGDSLAIDLRSVTYGGDQAFLHLPARPGDVVFVPERGDVMVEGWVETPGSYPITPGLTLLGSIAAAGGTLFPADPEAVYVVRTPESGGMRKLVYRADLARIQRGEEPDVLVYPGDVVDVHPSPPKAAVWGFYRFLVTIFHIGMGVTGL